MTKKYTYSIIIWNIFPSQFFSFQTKQFFWIFSIPENNIFCVQTTVVQGFNFDINPQLSCFWNFKTKEPPVLVFWTKMQNQRAFGSCSCKTQRTAWAQFHERSVKEPWVSVLVVWCCFWYPLKWSKLVLWEYLVFNVKIEGSRSSFCDQDPGSHLFLGTNTRTQHRH